ncbi:MAG: hypothetical protein FWB75_04980 [Oscillospiraceae bacterium]|nr:hypothetical protein [Oscillospiraceae bacterium]
MKKSASKRRRPVTKMALYLRAMRISLWLTITFFVLILLMALMGDANIEAGLQSVLLFAGGSTLIFFAILLIILSPLVLQDLSRIRNQEKHYGFSFNEEMKRLDVRQFAYTDEQWLVLVSRFRVYAYRKGFLTEFGFQRKSLLGKKMEAKIMAACADGKTRILTGGGATLSAIQDWAQSP